MPKRSLIIVAVVLGFVLIAAGLYGLTGGGLQKYLQLRTLDAQANRWAAQGLSSYQMTLRIVCFCPFTDRMPLTVEVSNGQVVSVVDSQGQPVAVDDPIRMYGNERFMTVDGVFEHARQAIRAADETTISYDPLLGYPASLSLDPIKMAIDDELYVTIEGLRPLP